MSPPQHPGTRRRLPKPVAPYLKVFFIGQGKFIGGNIARIHMFSLGDITNEFAKTVIGNTFIDQVSQALVLIRVPDAIEKSGS
jgi:hypothetical protein